MSDIYAASSTPPPHNEKPPDLTQPSERLKHFTFAWFALTMSTGGIALLLANQPYTFRGLVTIGDIVFIFDIVLFSCITAAICYRFLKFPGTFINAWKHPTEQLFIPAPLLSVATIISCMAEYGVPSTGSWLQVTIRVLFWIYFVLTFVLAVGQYTVLFMARAATIQSMTPAWILPIFPIMLTGTIAASSVATQEPAKAVEMIIAGFTAQGLGMLVSLLIYAQYIRRLMNYGLPSASTRAGMFIAVGPPSFTGLALIGMANGIPKHPFGYFAQHDTAAEILKIMALFTAIFLWSLAFWFFAVSLVSCLAAYRSMRFHLTWWSFVFPNVGFTVDTIKIGTELGSAGIKWVGSAMTIFVIVTYVFVFVAHVRAVWKKEILLEGKDEDSAE